MVGGRVIGIKKQPNFQVLLVVDNTYPTDTCRIHVGIQHEIKLWDSIWWQSGYAFWTPIGGKEKRIDRLSHSY